jgi:BMFP domain-containing protein YqiC
MAADIDPPYERTAMQTENRILDDMARVASGALSGFTGLRQEIEARMREQVERLLRDMDLVTREEFEAVKAVAATARAEQERLSERVAKLEITLAELGKSIPGAAAETEAPRTAP